VSEIGDNPEYHTTAISKYRPIPPGLFMSFSPVLIYNPVKAEGSRYSGEIHNATRISNRQMKEGRDQILLVSICPSVNIRYTIDLGEEASSLDSPSMISGSTARGAC